MNTKKNKKSGFTLVELMVVAIIVAILAAVAIPLMSGNKERAAATEAQAGISTIYTAERVEKAENGSYINAATPDILRGISDGDLQGKYFDHDDYAVTGAGTDAFLVTATGNGTASISGTVILTVSANGVSAWTGTLLD